MRFAALFSAWLFSAGLCAAEIVPFADAAGKLNEAWQPFSFAKIQTPTRYTIVQDAANGFVLHAIADHAASALKFPLDQSAERTPKLKFSWRIDAFPVGSNPSERSGDDYAARVYVTFAYDPQRVSGLVRAEYSFFRALHGSYPPHSAINYVVEPSLPVRTIIDNPFTARVKMIVVDNSKRLGEWHKFERDIVEDYIKAFGAPPPTNVSGIVVMTDADNTGTRAEASYGEITLTK
jgi:Protein of unknown function (DUF3047)